ncbi:MAG: UDP-N-acetylglucosamine--N-acetylmuramyl-(pentapeptide) pyrophosphoryl-undecaprenol N-acetylglucosamine transferase [Candidatus Asgardarchaeia archaeon]
MSTSKKIYIAACGIGLGHVSRCVAIADEIKNKISNVSIFFSTYGDGVNFVKKHNYFCFTVPPMELAEDPDGSVNAKKTAIKGIKGIFVFVKQLIAEIRNIKKVSPDIIISDTRLSTVIAGWLLRKEVVLIINQLKIIIPHKKPLTPLKKKIKKFGEIIILHNIMLLWNRSKKIFVSDFPPNLTISKDVLDIPVKLAKKIEYIGPILKIPEVNEKEIIKTKKYFASNGEKIIYIGLSGTYTEVESLRKVIEKYALKLPRHIKVVVSLGRPNENEFLYTKKNLSVYNWIHDRFTLMAASDLFVGRPGQLSVAETYYLGIPAVWIPPTAHTEQMTNAKSAERLGVGIVIPQNKLTFKKFKDAIDFILSHNVVLKRRLNIIKKKVKKYNGKRFLVEYIVSQFLSK